MATDPLNGTSVPLDHIDPIVQHPSDRCESREMRASNMRNLCTMIYHSSISALGNNPHLSSLLYEFSLFLS
ncbi:predicted protein [Botrytis cinerea T4]|uniref:Uncharacterized protein n=1 Tax=Botryotinia fuckeliana (strain T4) TaxID=999810 RepID=G2XZ04_BOTF4|nr:predicted protein [Botrytis cinerea T4]